MSPVHVDRIQLRVKGPAAGWTHAAAAALGAAIARELAAGGGAAPAGAPSGRLARVDAGTVRAAGVPGSPAGAARVARAVARAVDGGR